VCRGSCLSGYEVASGGVYGRHVCMLRMLWVLCSVLRSEHETPLLVDFAARPPHVFVLVLRARRLPLHVFAPVLFAHLLLEAAAQDAQNLSLVVTTFRGCELVVGLKAWIGTQRSRRGSCLNQWPIKSKRFCILRGKMQKILAFATHTPKIFLILCACVC
jgi:hypothetical protein